MKKIFQSTALLWLIFHAVTFGQSLTVYVDFGSSSYTTPSPSKLGHHWNNITESSAREISNLTSSTGNPTGFSLAVTGNLLSNPFGTTVPDPNTLGGLAIDSATRDWFYISGAETLTVSLRNLAPDGIYSLSLFGSRDWAGPVGSSDETRVTQFDVAGLTTHNLVLTTSALGIGVNPQPNANRSSIAKVENLSPDNEGRINITVRRNRGAFGYLGALRLEQMNVVNGSPTAQNVLISGAPRVGNSVIGRYSFFDAENDAESGTEFFWERAPSTNSTPTKISLSSANQIRFIPGSTELGQYIRLGVLPRAATGRQSGSVSYSRWIGPVVSTETLTSFHIGSSFTLWPDIPRQLRELGATTGRPLINSVQLTSGKNMWFHWENGIDGGAFNTGLPSRHELAAGGWDFLVLQPFNSEWMFDPTQMREYVRRYYNLSAPSGTQVYLYAGWPWYSQTVSTQAQINTVFEQARSSVSTTGNKPALIIPAGQAVRSVIEACGSGVLSSFTRASFYQNSVDPSDNLHLSSLGAYVVALTHYATIFKTSPVGLPARGLDAGFVHDNVVNFDPAVALRIQEIVWEVVSTYPNSGVTSASPPSPPPLTPNVLPPPVVVEPDPTFVTESNLPPDPVLLAHAFGPGEPGSPALQANLPRALAPLANGRFAVEYRVNPAAEASGVVYTPHWSYDLRRWTATQPSDTLIERTENTVKVSWPLSSRWRFLRIHVAPPPQ